MACRTLSTNTENAKNRTYPARSTKGCLVEAEIEFVEKPRMKEVSSTLLLRKKVTLYQE